MYVKIVRTEQRHSSQDLRDHAGGEGVAAGPEHEPSQLAVVLVELYWDGPLRHHLHHRALVAGQTPRLGLHHLAAALVQHRHQLLEGAGLGHAPVVDNHRIP